MLRQRNSREFHDFELQEKNNPGMQSSKSLFHSWLPTLLVLFSLEPVMLQIMTEVPTTEFPTTPEPTASEEPTTEFPTASEEPTTEPPNTPEPTTTEEPITEIPTTPEPTTTEESTTEAATTTEEPPFPTEAPFCPPTGVHNFPYPGNCTLYIRCFDGFEQVLSCAPLIFDKIDLICKPEGEALCDEEFPVQCPPVGYEALPHESSCSKYYECINGNAYESECAIRTYFDATPNLLRCNQAEVALCNSECPSTGLEFLAIRTSGCKWYKICIDGHSANLECGPGEVYSPVETKCVGDDEYTCPFL